MERAEEPKKRHKSKRRHRKRPSVDGEPLKRHLHAVQSCMNRNPVETRQEQVPVVDNRTHQRIGLVKNCKQSDMIMRNVADPVKHKVQLDLNRIRAHCPVPKAKLPRVQGPRSPRSKVAPATQKSVDLFSNKPSEHAAKSVEKTAVEREEPAPDPRIPDEIVWSRETGSRSAKRAATDQTGTDANDDNRFEGFTDEQLSGIADRTLATLPDLPLVNGLNYGDDLLVSLYDKLTAQMPVLKKFAQRSLDDPSGNEQLMAAMVERRTKRPRFVSDNADDFVPPVLGDPICSDDMDVDLEWDGRKTPLSFRSPGPSDFMNAGFQYVTPRYSPSNSNFTDLSAYSGDTQAFSLFGDDRRWDSPQLSVLSECFEPSPQFNLALSVSPSPPALNGLHWLNYSPDDMVMDSGTFGNNSFLSSPNTFRFSP